MSEEKKSDWKNGGVGVVVVVRGAQKNHYLECEICGPRLHLPVTDLRQYKKKTKNKTGPESRLSLSWFNLRQESTSWLEFLIPNHNCWLKVSLLVLKNFRAFRCNLQWTDRIELSSSRLLTHEHQRQDLQIGHKKHHHTSWAGCLWLNHWFKIIHRGVGQLMLRSCQRN